MQAPAEKTYSVEVLTGDITRLKVDAIVNAANTSLLGGGGVDGAIHRAGGQAILEACKKIRQESYLEGLPTGEAVITTGGNLAARHVIHTVGPIYHQEKDPARLLANCYRNSLRLAMNHGMTSLAFPAISTGVYGYPKEAAAQVASAAIHHTLAAGSGSLQRVILVAFAEADADLLRQAIEMK
ncbi:MAG: O-acetyl-ADP-ribose deacetylase [Magnetococcales bacterium]|nr:O-acetyl-ADP-ribose deacetylase [Magnetococcales bacterium]MBF0323236.1 O-acetyl-ADP-ribose deacetylase [Magnetococcales bacterium]